MRRLSDREFAAAVSVYIEGNGPDYVKKIEYGLRASGISSSRRPIIEAVGRRGSGLLIAKCGKGRKVCLKESADGKVPSAPEPAAAVELTPPNRMAEFGCAVAVAFASLPKGCKASVTLELNEEMPF